MKLIRRRVIMLTTWLFGFYSIDKFLDPIDISDNTYLFMMGIMLISLATPRLTQVPFWAFLIAPLLVFSAFRIWTQPLDDSAIILLFIFESVAIFITTFLSHRASLAIGESELAIARLIFGQRERVTEDASLGSGALYREVRRSRNHHRPLALLAVAIDETSLHINVDRIIHEAQKAIIKQYALSAVARLLYDRLEDCDTIVQDNGHFLVLLPETTREDIPNLIERLCRQSVEQIGVELKIGAASLPEDSYTLEGLIDQATHGIKTDLTPEFSLEFKRMSAQRRAT